jgi:Concanavalin A-like lectin/glucanases superfamily
MPIRALAPVSVAAGAPSIVAALRVGLVAYWKLDEASGTRVDATGRGNDLTDNNTVTQAAGKIGQAAQFVRTNSEFLTRTSTADLTTGNVDFTFSAWVYLDSKPADYMNILSKWAANGEYELHWQNDVDEFIMGTRGAGFNAVARTVPRVHPSALTWYHIIAWQDAGGATTGISVNGVEGTASVTSPINATAAVFGIGELTGVSPGFRSWDGRIDEVGMWRRLLTSTEKAALYNSGNGLALY